MNKLIDFIKRFKSSIKTRYRILKDASEVFLGLRHPLIPPNRYNYINIGINETIGKEFLEHFINKADLKPTDQVLEVGSGFGRMAIPLTEYLSTEGLYEGLELLKDGVNWCQSNFTPKFPNFKFQRIDVYNARYNTAGTQKAETYRFPFKDGSFDFVYLTSVFTHMYPNEIANYLKEVSRVMKPRGTCLCTYYLINDISKEQIKNHLGTYNFEYSKADYYIEDLKDPLYQIAFKEPFIKLLYADCNLDIEAVYYGSWSGRQDFLSFQDIIIAKNKS